MKVLEIKKILLVILVSTWMVGCDSRDKSAQISGSDLPASGKIESNMESDLQVTAASLPPGWMVDGSLVDGHCFWALDGRNEELKEFAAANGIPEGSVDDYLLNPGRYIGEQIKVLSPIKLDGYELGAGRPLDDCIDGASRLINPSDSFFPGVVQHRRTFEVAGQDPWELDAFYIIRASVSLDLCQSLVSQNFPQKCEQAFLVSILFDVGSGSTWSHGIHGIFSENGRRYIVPLKHWQHWFTEAEDWSSALDEAMAFVQKEGK